MGNLNWLKIFTSPFKAPKPYFYIGKIRVGAPYFLPRKWVKSGKEGYLRAIPCKWLWLDVVDLGWKDKWDSTRHEWNPVWSLVILRLQFAVIWRTEDFRCWESYIGYEYYTDKSKSVKERLNELTKKFPNVWVNTKEGVVVKTDYLKKSLKKRYRLMI